MIIPKMGRAKILAPVMDYDEMSMFHCHIVEHKDIGMMGLWHIMGMMRNELRAGDLRDLSP